MHELAPKNLSNKFQQLPIFRKLNINVIYINSIQNQAYCQYNTYIQAYISVKRNKIQKTDICLLALTNI